MEQYPRLPTMVVKLVLININPIRGRYDQRTSQYLIQREGAKDNSEDGDARVFFFLLNLYQT